MNLILKELKSIASMPWFATDQFNWNNRKERERLVFLALVVVIVVIVYFVDKFGNLNLLNGKNNFFV